MPEAHFSVPEFAKAAGRDAKTIRKGVADGTIRSFRIHKGGQPQIPASELERFCPTRTRLASELGALAIDPAIQSIDFRGTTPDADYCRRSMALVGNAKIEVHVLEVPVRVAVDGVRPPEAGHLVVVTEADPAPDTAAFTVGGKRFAGRAVIAARLPGAVRKGRDLGLSALYDCDHVTDLIEFPDDEAAGDPQDGEA